MGKKSDGWKRFSFFPFRVPGFLFLNATQCVRCDCGGRIQRAVSRDDSMTSSGDGEHSVSNPHGVTSMGMGSSTFRAVVAFFFFFFPDVFVFLFFVPPPRRKRRLRENHHLFIFHARNRTARSIPAFTRPMCGCFVVVLLLCSGDEDDISRDDDTVRLAINHRRLCSLHIPPQRAHKAPKIK